MLPMFDDEAPREGASDHDCDGCAAGMPRRAFLRGAFDALALTALASLGATSAAAAATVRETSALGRRGEVCTYAIPASDGVEIDRANEVILARWQGHVYAFALSCPHQNTALRWNASQARFQCPKHKSQYRPDGVFITGRATRSMDRHAIHRDGGNVQVDLARVFRQDQDAAAWAAACADA